MKPIYFDNSSAARPSPEATSKMLNFYTEKWGTPLQPHKMGQELFPALQEAYEAVSELLGVSQQDSLVFTSSSADAILQAMISTYEDVSLVEGKNHFISVANEEPHILSSLQRLQRFGCPVTLMKPSSQGVITPQSLIEAITPRTALLAISWVSGLTGVIQPIEEIAKICQLRGIRLLVDATHALGKLFFNLKDLPIDFLVFNGSPLHAPQGIGGLYIHQGLKASHLDYNNVPAIVALGVASKQALQARDYLCTEVARLKIHFENEIAKRIPESLVLFKEQERVPHISAIAFPGIVNEALLFLLNQRGLFACMGGGTQQQINHYLNLCGMDPLISASALSFSFSRETTEEEIDCAITYLEPTVAKLRKASAKLMVKA